MVKKNKKNSHKFKIIIRLIIILLLISNIFLFRAYNHANKETIITQEVLYKETKKDYNKENKYYANIKYKKFEELWKSNKISTIAIVDNSTTTYNKFIEMINKLAYYKNTKIYLLETSKLSKKEEIKFFDLNKKFSELETNYIITISNKKIVSVTTFNNEKLNEIIEGIGE